MLKKEGFSVVASRDSTISDVKFCVCNPCGKVSQNQNDLLQHKRFED